MVSPKAETKGSGDAAAIAAYLGKKDTFDKAALAFSQRYADLTEADHARFVAREKSMAVTLPAPPPSTEH